MRVAVVGGGISGLAAAFELVRQLPGADVVVLEASGSIGGKLQTGSVAGIEVDLGAEAMLARRPEGIELVRAAGLGEEIIAPLTTQAQVRAGGALHPLPARTMLGIPSDVAALRASGAVSEAAASRVLAEPDAAPLPPLHDDITVGSLVRDRLGNEITDRLVAPLLGGVYAGRVDELSLRATMPTLAARLHDGGSLVEAARAVTDVGTHDPAAGAVFASLRAGGLGRLPAALAATGGFTVRTSTTVRGIHRTESGFALITGPTPDEQRLDVDAVLVAVPAAKAALLLRDIAPAAASELATIESASVAIVTFAFDAAAASAVPPGSGLLVAMHEQLATKAVTVSSQKWPMQTGDLLMLRASLGRAGDAQVLQRSDDELIALVRGDLKAIFGLDADPVDAVVTRWGGGLPQYAVGHVERIERVRAVVAGVPGLAVCGAAYDGVGIPACVASAHRAADHVVAALSRQGE